ncbi:Protein-S-isoprenylcysteine O-methyltransferase Ste14 [Monaibacterium marinum]|uniref:Protein-S-isoprenylcysteine O-methyltransferase Ste14 n=1 Tax=Pontivivens marinum TaxID=1690039 RepID=A0A2C9CVR9_9RHOB|nr:isoprenylcysteine carboxylmethyltransferase family protein [Monaibacterium marinum]SOH95404.1 Protein-S-isoprenylcysteine O-methyltransferase Ste14 [Monaibacterium marinum]
MANADSPNIVFYPPVLFAMAPIVALVLQRIAPLGLLEPAGDVQQAVGIAILALALALGLWGVVVFKRAGTNVSPHTPALLIVSSGPYRFSRNPMYIAIELVQLGLGLAVSMEWSIIIAPLALIALHYGVVLREEAYLTEKFGDQYTEYKQQTRRWL